MQYILENNSLKQKILLTSCAVFIFSLMFQAVIPGVVQLPEIIFAAIIVLAVLFRFTFFPRKLNLIDAGILVYLFSLCLSAFFSGEKSAFVEIGKSFYLAGVYLLFRRILEVYENSASDYFLKTFSIAGLIAGSVGIAGYIFSIVSQTQFQTSVYGSFPYTGTITRLIGFTGSPTMYILFLSTCLCSHLEFTYRSNKNKIFNHLTAFVITLAALLTFSKSIILFFFAMTAFHLLKRKQLKFNIKLTAALFIIAAIGMIAGTHFIFFRAGGQAKLTDSNVPYVSARTVLETENYKVNASIYTTLKAAAIKTGKENFWTGCGPGEFQNELKKMQEKNEYPKSSPLFLPHSTLTGAFAETGIFGLTALLFLFFTIGIYYWKNRVEIEFQFGPALLILLLITSVELISTDVMHIRQYWVMLGFIAGVKKYNLPPADT